MYYVELSSCNPISSNRVFLLRLWFQSAFRIFRSILEIDHRGCSWWLEAHAWLSERFQLVLGLTLDYPAWIGARCHRTVAPKGGRFRSRTGNRDLKMFFIRLNLFTSSLLGTSTKAWSNISRLVYLSPLSLATSSFHRLDLFSWCSLD
jgi:hypothetical protein